MSHQHPRRQEEEDRNLAVQLQIEENIRHAQAVNTTTTATTNHPSSSVHGSSHDRDAAASSATALRDSSQDDFPFLSGSQNFQKTASRTSTYAAATGAVAYTGPPVIGSSSNVQTTTTTTDAFPPLRPQDGTTTTTSSATSIGLSDGATTNSTGSSSGAKSLSRKRPQHLRNHYHHCWYDITRQEDGDVMFQTLLGEYGNSEPLPLELQDRLKQSSFLTNPTALSLAAMVNTREEENANVSNHGGDSSLPSSNDSKSQLHQYCQRVYGTQPQYTHHQTGPAHAPGFQATLHIFLERQENASSSKLELQGPASQTNKKHAEQLAAKIALEHLQSMETKTSAENGDSTGYISFRGAATRLPFAIQFQLERCVFATASQGDCTIPLVIKKRPRGLDAEEERAKVVLAARKLLLVLIQIVLPPLLQVDWKTSDSITLSELVALELWDALLEMKRIITKGGVFVNFATKVERALAKARQGLLLAQTLCQVADESDLNGGLEETSFQTIQKRSTWPMAEYKCRLSKTSADMGRLIPVDFQMVNVSKSAPQHQQPITRRALREYGWHVRNRFILVSNVKFQEPIVSNLVPFMKTGKFSLCSRSNYEYLFDKGTGKPDLWLFSSSSETTRDSFLRELGDTSQVVPTKLGDRISLAFTQTVPIMKLALEDIVAIPEIVRNGYTFSDGCGVMGIGVAKRIQQIMIGGDDSPSNLPGSVQIRIGGIKGMLSLSTTFPPNKIGIRPSMKKFASNHRILEVKRIPILNENPENKLFHQILLIMNHLKVPNRVFLDLQAKACADMASKYDPEKQQEDDGDDYNRAYDYVQNVVRHGLKSDGSPFSPEELSALKKTMSEAKNKVNLRCDIVLCMGVLDEHHELGEGEVLVGNGAIQGAVLICRSPCNMPGDIQKAYAVPPKRSSRYECLKNCLVFSAKGSRPLADKLSGGDLDGDEYYVILEKNLVGMLQCADAHDFGSQKNGVDIPRTLEIGRSFQVLDAPPAPDIDSQLGVFQQLLSMGNLVGNTSDAWIRIADVEGPGSPAAIQMAEACLQALDARKMATTFTPHQLNEIKRILREFKAPHWKCGGSLVKGRKSASILGVLFTKWRSWIESIEKTERRRNLIYQGVAQEGADLNDDDETVVSIAHECVVCLARGDIRCSLCTGEVWVCAEGGCKENHWNEMGHHHSQVGSGRAAPFVVAIPESDCLIDHTIQMDNRMDPLDMLLDVTFRRLRPQWTESFAISYERLDASDMESLVNMVLLEYSEELRAGIMASHGEKPNRSKETPHAFDVFSRKTSSYRQGDELVVYRPAPGSGGELAWFDEHGDYLDDDADVQYEARVTSLSGPIRILESLRAQAELKTLAMSREAIFSVEECCSDEISFEESTSYSSSLNASQRKVVAAVASRTFRSGKGFLAVQGPPGTGKTTTIIGIISAIETGIIVTAPSNAAVANLALRLASMEQFGVHNIIVWGENCDPSVRFLNPVHRHKRYLRFFKSYSDTDDKDIRRSKLQDFAAWLRLKGDNLSLDELEQLCEDPAKPLSSVKVVLCTLNTAGSTTLRRSLDRRFNLLILDEAGQCPEAEFYIATTIPGVKSIVIVGDPQQLPSTVLNQNCRVAGYGESFLAHVMEFQPGKVYCLDRQYRMDPSIFEFSNHHFYRGNVSSDESVSRRDIKIENPFSLVDTSGLGEEKRVNSSWMNEHESIVIRDILRNDKDIIRLVSESSEEAEDALRTIIVSPYLAQTKYLRGILKKLKHLKNIEVATIDSFQGQEGDIVIVSTVRTKRVGFTDDPQRVNVALTRARRILRVVGDAQFFGSLSEPGSILKQLAAFAKSKGCILPSSSTAAWRPPDWSNTTTWKPVMTSSFHHALKMANGIRRNVAFNTLLAVATPHLNELREFPAESEQPRWQMSSLKSFSGDLYVVWIPLENDSNARAQTTSHFVGVIQAHFTGGRNKCLQYIQGHRLLPAAARAIKKDLSALVRRTDSSTPTNNPDLSWLVTNDLQMAVLANRVQELPEGIFVLDPDQERIVARPAPLLLESRSGTGKTNVLFQHAVRAARRGVGTTSAKPLCFVTVSLRLRDELQRRFEEVRDMHHAVLPEIMFFSFRDLLGSLLQTFGVENVHVVTACSFSLYLTERKSHEKLSIEQSLIENEIGGVIVGSLTAAMRKRPLTKKEYLEEIRSNVPNDTDAGRRTRLDIFDEFKAYNDWKEQQNRYDLGDIVLQLIRLRAEADIFQSAYLDEIQDFSHASIYLICSVAGKMNLQWVAAGDTAQMISPGCSFTFDGLKQTLRAIHDGKAPLQKVEQLQRNYRLTRSVLEVGNAVLKVLKTYYPEALAYVQPEIAMKDLGLSVALVEWDASFKTQVSFGTQQALIYSTGVGPVRAQENFDINGQDESDGRSDVESRINKWLGDHPFVLTSLDAKGLEFDDVVVVFDFAHKAWKVERRTIETLRLLKELYVAVTRAKRRVVILVKRKVPAMLEFFEMLDCDAIDANLSSNVDILPLEFETETTAEMWFAKGRDLFEDEQYRLAASCFKSADSFGWVNWANGKYMEMVMGQSKASKDVLRTAAKIFFESADYEECLNVFKDIRAIPPWEESDNDMLDEALDKLPNYLPRRETIEFAIARNRWNVISADDLKLKATAEVFVEMQSNERLKTIVSACGEDDLEVICESLPFLVGEMYTSQSRFVKAISIFLRVNDKVSVDRVIDVSSKHDEAKSVLKTASAYYKEASEYELCLDVMKKLRSMTPLDDNDKATLLFALRKKPKYLQRRDTIELALLCDGWELISRNDLKSKSLVDILAKHRSDKQLTTLVQECSDEDRASIERVHPNIIGDYYFEREEYSRAAALFRRGRDNSRASNAERLHAEREEKAKQLRLQQEKQTAKQQKARAKRARQQKARAQEQEAKQLQLQKHKEEEANAEKLRQQVAKKSSRVTKAPTPTAEPLTRGDRVLITGLENAKHLNGESGTVVTALNQKTGRYGIRIENVKKEVTVKPANIIKIVEEKSNNLQGNFDGSDYGSDSSGDFPGLGIARPGKFRGSDSDDSDSADDTWQPAGSGSSSEDEEGSESSDAGIPDLEDRHQRDSSGSSNDDDSDDDSVPDFQRRNVAKVFDSSSDDQEERQRPVRGYESSDTDDSDVPPLTSLSSIGSRQQHKATPKRKPVQKVKRGGRGRKRK